MIRSGVVVACWAVCMGLYVEMAGAVQMRPFVEMAPKDKVVSVEITNDDKLAHDYLISLTPMASLAGEPLSLEAAPALLFNPSSLRLAAGQTGKVNLRYNGGALQQEFYYRLQVKEQGGNTPAQSAGDSSKGKASANYGVSVSTLVLVRPRVLKMDYQWQGGVLRNTGNAGLWVMHDKQCGKLAGTTEFLMPQQNQTIPLADDSIVAVGVQDVVKIISSRCAN